ncbi:MAG: hypothetical protein K9G13_06525 [Aquiluna sp.]|nr:hypothetical protein [Aquiluna sp.]MCF8546171.1 hypothetical protein [Aquiluna sp.]
MNKILKRSLTIAVTLSLLASVAGPALATADLIPGPSPELLIQQTVPQATISSTPLAVIGVDYKIPQFLIGLGNSENPTDSSEFALWDTQSSIGGGCVTVVTCDPFIEVWSMRNGQRVDFSVSRFQRFSSGRTGLIQFENKNSADPADAGVLPGDELNFRIQPGIFTIPDQPVMDSPYVRYDFVYISSTYGTIGNNGPIATETGGVLADYVASQVPESPSTPAIPNYEGPVNVRHSASSFCEGSLATLSGLRLDTISSVEVDGEKVAHELFEDGRLAYSLSSVAPGTHSVRLSVPKNSLFLTTSVIVRACNSLTNQTASDAKVNVGSFGGKLVVYASDLDGAKISWKVAGKWGTALATGNQLNRFDRPLGASGLNVMVEIYVDGQKQLTKTVLTR